LSYAISYTKVRPKADKKFVFFVPSVNRIYTPLLRDARDC